MIPAAIKDHTRFRSEPQRLTPCSGSLSQATDNSVQTGGPKALLQVTRPPTRSHAMAVYAWLLDSSIRLPGGFRIGFDGLLGLIPVVGDMFSAFVSGGIVLYAMRAGVDKLVILRMLGNTLLDLIVGAIPIAGDLFDFAFRANERNVRLLEQAILEPERLRRRSLRWIIGIALLLATIVVLTSAALWQILAMLSQVTGG